MLTEVPPVLYHYTSAEGLLGIFRTEELRETDAEFLNDARELNFGREELCRELESAGEQLSTGGYGTPGYNRGTVMKSAAEALRRSAANSQSPSTSVYVACFCENGDLLSQWRGYAAGGYAIGFRTAALSSIDSQAREAVVPETTAWPTTRLTKIAYGSAAVAMMVDRVLDEIAPDWVERMGKPGSRGAVHADTVAIPALASVKHQDFAEEREWRLISVVDAPRSEVRFRASTLGVVPYLALPLPLSAVSHIVVGPGSNDQLRQRGVQRLAQHHRLTIEINLSEAPFRG